MLKNAEDGDFTVTVTVSSVELDATASVLATNMFNDPPAEGMAYAVVGLTLTYAGGTGKQSATTFDLGTSVFSQAGVEHNGTANATVAPEPRLLEFGEMLAGATVTGNEVFDYEVGTTPLLRVEESFCFSNCDELWFALR